MTELHGLQSSIEEFEERDVEVIAISPDSVERNAEVAQRLGLEFAVLADGRGCNLGTPARWMHVKHGPDPEHLYLQRSDHCSKPRTCFGN